MSDNGNEVEATNTEALIMSLLPFADENKKVRYIGYRASGFEVRECIQLIGIHEKTLRRWRDDPKFLEMESRIPELRKTLGNEYAHLEFLRNYRLILQKDYNIIAKSMKTALSPQEHQYLIKARSHYTPTQLEVLQSLLSADSGTRKIDFAEFVVTMSRQRTEETITMQAKRDDSIDTSYEEIE